MSKDCPNCAAGHAVHPCSAPCVCRCRKCSARLHCRGEPENWPKPLSEVEAKRRGMVLTPYGYIPAASDAPPASAQHANAPEAGSGNGAGR